MNDYVKYLEAMISQEEEALGKTSNKAVRSSIMRRISLFKEDLRLYLSKVNYGND